MLIVSPLVLVLIFKVNYLSRACRNIRGEGLLLQKEVPTRALAERPDAAEASAETFPDAESDDDSDELTPMHMLDLGVVTAMGSSQSTLPKSRQKSILDADVLVRLRILFATCALLMARRVCKS